MFEFFRKQETPNFSKYVLELADRIGIIESDIKSLKIDIQRIEIKAFENQAKYLTKLAKITTKEKEEKQEETAESSMFLKG